MKEPIKVAIAGLGNRGMDIYAHYAHFAPDEMQVVAAAEPIREKLEKAKKEYNIPAENCFSTVEELLQAPKLADVLVIATQDQYHVSQAIPALEKGYHILCEKPISPNLEECLKLRDKAHECHRSVAIGHVLRYTPFFSKIKELIQEGRIGDVVSVQGIENVMYWHQAHSYVRGNWRDSTTSSPMILAKSCHDLDIFVWLLDKKCERLSSYGSTYLFKESNAPEGSTLRCMDGCKAKENCPYDAEKIYITSPRTGIRNVLAKNYTDDNAWPCNVLVQELTEENVRKAIETGPYGRCVYHCDNNVVDHQVVNMEFEGGTTVTFTMSAFTSGSGRDIKIMGTMGDIVGSMTENKITVTNFGKPAEVIDVLTLSDDFSGHAGGDNKLIHDFLVSLSQPENLRTGIDQSIESHVIAFAAEYSRLHNGKNVELSQFIAGEYTD